MTDDAYVYAIFVDDLIRYIGKGSGKPLKRATEHIRTAKRLLARRASGEVVWERQLYNRLAKAIKDGSKIDIRILGYKLTHEEAFDREVKEIAALPDRQLWNSDKGGLGTGRMSAEHREKLSEAAKRRLARPGERERLRQIGLKSKTPEHRQRLREWAIQRNADAGFKESLRKKQKEKWADPLLSERMKNGLDKGRKAPRSPERNAKRWQNPIHRDNQKCAMKRKWSDPLFREKMLQEMKVRMNTEAGRAAIQKMISARWAGKGLHR